MRSLLLSTLLVIGLTAPGFAETRSAAAGDSSRVTLPSDWGRPLLLGTYASLYGTAAKVGSRLGLEGNFRVHRLESAWALDIVGHVYAVGHVSRLFSRVHRWAGDDARSARRKGAWQAAFGAYFYMETINGFMPGVRFDWVDPISNAAGAAIVSEGPDLAEDHPWLRRLSLELGYKDWSKLTEEDDESGPLTRVWHDYPNQRFGLGYGIGPLDREWMRLFLTYDVTSLEIEDLKNVFGMGLEIKPQNWLAPWIERVPGGGGLLGFVRAIDRHVLLPGLYFQLFTVEVDAFSDREPFTE